MRLRPALAICALVPALFQNSCTRESSPREIAEKYIAAENKAWSSGSLADLEALEDPDVVYHMPGVELKGWKAHADYIRQGRPKVSDLKKNWKYLSGEGNEFALAYESSAILKGDEKTPATSSANSFLFFVRLANGKLVEVWMNGSTTTGPAAN